MTLNRRNFLELSAATAAVSAVGVSAVRATPADDTIIVGIAARGPRLVDPNLTTQGADNWTTEQIFEQLVRPADGTFGTSPEEYLPFLAISWDQSEDSKTWIFHLREGVQFHKGYGEMTAEDVVYSFERAMNDGVRTTLYSNIANVSASGDYTVTMTLATPDPLFLGSTIFTNNPCVVSKKASVEKGEDFGTDPIGTGPYQLVEFDPEAGTKLIAFDEYWGGRAKTTNIVFEYIPDTTARTLALLSGDVDMIEGVRAPGWVASMLQRKPELLFDMTVPGSFNTLHVNLTRPPFDDIRVRQALMYALNPSAIAQALAPMGGTMPGLQPTFFPGGFEMDELPEDLRYEHNQDKARALLAEAGYPDGFDFESNASQREDYGSQMLIVQEQLRAVGMRMDLHIIDHTAYHANNRTDMNTLALHSSSYPPIPSNLYLDQLSSKSEVKSDSSGGGNYSHYGVAIPGVDDLIDKVLNATNFDDYVAACREVELQVLRDLPLIGLTTLSYTIARNPRMDLGFEVKSGYARWRLNSATVTG